jgi:transcriptional regulator with XRE-family HTH domain
MPLGKELRELRAALGLSQGEVSEAYGATQSRVSDLENNRRPVAEQLEYRQYLASQLPTSRQSVPSIFSGFSVLDNEGPRIYDDASLRGKLPSEWQLLGTTRCGAKHELGYVFDHVRESYGIVGFYRNASGELKRTSVIPFEPLYYRFILAGLMKFLSGHYPLPTEHAHDSIAESDDEADDSTLAPIRQPLKRGGWDETLLNLLRALHSPTFTLDEAYTFQHVLRSRFPQHKDPRSGIRATLQRLRDRGYVHFLGGGRYRLSPNA